MKEEIETASRKLLLAFNNRCHQPRLACCFLFILNLLLLTIFHTQPLIQQTWEKNAQLTRSFATAYKTLLGKRTNTWSALRRTLPIDRLGLLTENEMKWRKMERPRIRDKVELNTKESFWGPRKARATQ